MDTALPQKFPFILDRNLAKANCTSCDTVVLVTTVHKKEQSNTVCKEQYNTVCRDQ